MNKLLAAFLAALLCLSSVALASDDDDYRRPAPVPKAKPIKVIQQQAAKFEARLNAHTKSQSNARSNATANANANAGGGAGGSVAINHEGSAASASDILLTATQGTCMGSVGLGLQGVSFGASVGTTVRDDKCDMRKDVGLLVRLRQPLAAFMRLCMDDDMAMALKYAGRPCPELMRAHLGPMARSAVDEPTE